ncbi:hypothetical protein GF415_01675 [Candidatus Micrarchaeota archaeon]|nr:hypothetical protein [Candidatus Micrarchaeota archaeon]
MNYRMLLLALVAFSFLLAGCGGKKAGPVEQAPAEELEEETGADSEESEEQVEQASPEEDTGDTPSEESEELANLFDIEIEEPPEDFKYEPAPGEEEQ